MPDVRPLSGVPKPEGELLELFRARGPALVALSGGVDSSVVATLAHRALGPEALAATVVSASVSAGELAAAEEVARTLGIRHVTVGAEPLDDAQYRANESDRCYRCRTVETRALVTLGATEGVRQYLDGIHLDDLSDDRPGIRAMDEAGFFHPLLWAGWTKADTRRYARSVGLPNWDRPSNACLASRVARGEPISRELLERIDRAESFLLERGFRRVRVRVRDGSARVEVDAAELARLGTGPLRRELAARLHALGFRSATLDPQGTHPRQELPVLR